MSTTKIPDQQRFVLFSKPWKTYIELGRLFQDQRGVRITYDRGVLQLATVSHEHEHLALLLAFLTWAWTEERGVLIKSGGSTTFRRRDLERGLEPDQCFWIANEPAVRHLNRIDVRRDPPPDLVIEVEVTRRAVPRLPIFAALHVPEVWRLSRKGLTFQLRQSDGTYAPVARSQALPPLGSRDLERFLALRGQTDENSIVAQFRSWIRQLPKPRKTP
jgi:Uma2 family endonuclease